MIRFCVLAAVAACGFLCTCDSKSSSDTAANVLATETWGTAFGSSTMTGSSTGSFILSKLDNGTITITGHWQNTSASDSNATGTFTINGTAITMSFSGTAKASGSSATSTYNGTLTGTMGSSASGSGSGTYLLTFNAAGWPSDSGTWTATRSGGSGITP
jgi:hypothetical protein